MALKYYLEKTLSLLFILGLFATSCIACTKTVGEVIPTIIYDREPVYNESVVTVSSLNINGDIQGVLGTGFVVSSNLIMTAGHLCNSFVERQEAGIDIGIVLITASKKGFPDRVMPAEILDFKFSETDDMCILSSEGHGLKPFLLASDLEYGLAQIHDSVTIVGSPRGIPYVQISGSIIIIEKDILHIRAYIDGGNSGGPVILNGKVIGMIVAYSKGYRFDALAVPLPELKEFLNNHLK